MRLLSFVTLFLTKKEAGVRIKGPIRSNDHHSPCISIHAQAVNNEYVVTMESAGLGHREKIAAPIQAVDIIHDHSRIPDLHPPKYVIDLSLPPPERYKHVVRDFKDELAALPILFDEIVALLHPNISIQVFQSLAHLFLRHVHNREENEELLGIHQETGIKMYLLVAFNVLLDLLMGCTSGGARVSDGIGPTKMLHFRTLDWSMDPLRKVVVHLDFVDKPGGNFLASSITYVGFVGVLTGVKKGLSMSLNFRPNHNRIAGLATFRFYFHHLLVLLGYRPSISSLLRQVLIPSIYSSPVVGSPATLKSIERNLPTAKSTAAYLIFSDGDRTMTLEKDHTTAVIKSSDKFIVSCNHDVAFDNSSKTTAEALDAQSNALKLTGREDFIEESVDRKKTVTGLWERSSTRRKRDCKNLAGDTQAVTTKKVCEWVDTYPVTNETTHYGVIMDPKKGEVTWIKAFMEPVEVNNDSSTSDAE